MIASLFCEINSFNPQPNPNKPIRNPSQPNLNPTTLYYGTCYYIMVQTNQPITQPNPTSTQPQPNLSLIHI